MERHEAKYVIPHALVGEIREYLRPFCEPDFNGHGDPPEYVINTIQLDAPGMPLHYAKEWESLNRFKLRVRTYGQEVGKAPVFMEVKRKIRGMVVKTRTAIPFEKWSGDLFRDKPIRIDFRTRREEVGFLDFLRLTKQIGARPVTIIRYVRESYFGRNDHYARISFDRKLEYQPTTEWNSWGRGGRWISMDSSLQQGKLYPFSGVVLELKTLCDAPQWMMDLVMNFDLMRVGNCKYSTAVWNEAIYRGTPAAPNFATELLCW